MGNGIGGSGSGRGDHSGESEEGGSSRGGGRSSSSSGSGRGGGGGRDSNGLSNARDHSTPTGNIHGESLSSSLSGRGGWSEHSSGGGYTSTRDRMDNFLSGNRSFGATGISSKSLSTGSYNAAERSAISSLSGRAKSSLSGKNKGLSGYARSTLANPDSMSLAETAQNIDAVTGINGFNSYIDNYDATVTGIGRLGNYTPDDNWNQAYNDGVISASGSKRASGAMNAVGGVISGPISSGVASSIGGKAGLAAGLGVSAAASNIGGLSNAIGGLNAQSMSEISGLANAAGRQAYSKSYDANKSAIGSVASMIAGAINPALGFAADLATTEINDQRAMSALTKDNPELAEAYAADLSARSASNRSSTTGRTSDRMNSNDGILQEIRSRTQRNRLNLQQKNIDGSLPDFSNLWANITIK